MNGFLFRNYVKNKHVQNAKCHLSIEAQSHSYHYNWLMALLIPIFLWFIHGNWLCQEIIEFYCQPNKNRCVISYFFPRIFSRYGNVHYHECDGLRFGHIRHAINSLPHQSRKRRRMRRKKIDVFVGFELIQSRYSLNEWKNARYFLDFMFAAILC